MDNDYLALSGGSTRRSGGLIQLIGNLIGGGLEGLRGSVQFILGEGKTDARHRFYNSDTQPKEVASIDNKGNLILGRPAPPDPDGGAIRQIYGQPNVGIASNTLDDLIFNYNGAVIWFKGTQGGGAQAPGQLGTQKMKLDVDGSLWLGSTPRKAIDSQGRCLYAP